MRQITAAGLVGRVGGLAVALGAGVVISLAASAPASADSSRGGTDSAAAERSDTPRRGVTRSTPTESGTRALVARPSASVTARAITSPAPSPVPSPAPSAALRGKASRSVLAGPAPEPVLAAAAELSRRAVSPSVPAAAVAVPAASTAAPVAAPTVSAPAPQPKSVRSLFGWGDPRGRLITIYKGTHFAIPNSFGFFIKQVSGTGTFTANTVYDLGDVDQFDWNKFTGIAFTPLQPDRNSVMVGWRYNLISKEFEIAPFYNVDKKRILPNERTEVISVPADQTFTYFVDYAGVTISYGDKTVFKPYPEGLTPNVWTAARVSGWFGGNEVAPRTVSYFLKLT
jgi:hypothetical protein